MFIYSTWKRKFITYFFKPIPFFLIGLGTQIISILHRPSSHVSDSPDAFCNFYISKFNFFFIHLDCDAQYFLLDSQNPMRMIHNQSPLDDRPLFTYLVYIISNALEMIGIPAGPITYLGADGIPQTYNLLNYVLFIVINATILLVSMYFVSKVLFTSKELNSSYSKVLLLTSILIVSQNPVTREFFWTPHSQLFNILIPCLLFYMTQPEYVVTKGRYRLVMFSLSTALLMYPTFFIVLPIFFFKTLRTLGKRYALMISLCLIPKFLWPIILNTLGGSYTDNPIVHGRRFIWILDALRSKALIEVSNTKFLDFLNSLPLLWVVITLIVTCIGAINFAVFRRSGSEQKAGYNRDSLFMLGIYFVAIILNGQYGARFTTGVVILLCLIVLKEATHIKLLFKYWWALYCCLVFVNIWFWVSN